jgi:hypothetical protein
MIKKLWIVAVLLLIVHFIIQYGFYIHYDYSSLGWISLASDVLGNVLLIIVSGGVLGALFALIPSRGKNYLDRFKIALPLLISFALLLVITAFIFIVFYGKQKGYKDRENVYYHNITIPAGTNCSSIHNGEFIMEDYLIKRHDTIQVETNLKSGKTVEFKVDWINDCEYSLTPVRDSLKKTYIKVTQVNEDYYTCYGKVDEDMPAVFFKINRMKD